MKQPHPLTRPWHHPRFAAASETTQRLPVHHWPVSLQRLRSNFPPLPDAERFRNIRISTTGIAVEFFSGTSLGFGNRGGARQRWCNPEGGDWRLPTTARTTWANGKHLARPGIDARRWVQMRRPPPDDRLSGCDGGGAHAKLLWRERGLHETDVVSSWSRVTAVCRGQHGCPPCISPEFRQGVAWMDGRRG